MRELPSHTHFLATVLQETKRRSYSWLRHKTSCSNHCVAVFNDTDPPNALAIDECTVADNVEFFSSTLGERRKGCTSVTITDSDLEGETVIVFLGRHFPTDDEIDNELWAVGATPGTSAVVCRRSFGTWSTVTLDDAMDPAEPEIYNIAGLSLDNKFYFAYPTVGDVDRMHVWDGTDLRLTGLSEPNAPSVANEGAGTYTGTRYFRVRYIQRSGSTILLRSEPSGTTTFEPSGTGAGARISRPSLLGEGETHWEVEASLDNANFYVIATLATGTTTYDDETDYDDGYVDQGSLSDDIGAYTLLPAARFLVSDTDRLILAASFVDEDLSSRVMWTPVRGAPGAGNNERLDATTDYYVDLSPNEGGGLTGISEPVSGSMYAFKRSHVYKLVRTGNRADAYNAITLSKARGALPGSIVSGMDEYGRPCVYFLDPRVGPSRVSGASIQQINGLRTTWKRVNASATDVVARGIYYPDKAQVWWWVAVDGEDSPSLRFVLQVDQLRETEHGGVRRGWSLATGPSAEAYSATPYTETMQDDLGNTFRSTRPIMGLVTPHFIQRGDLGDTDNGERYIARLRSRPLFTTGLLNRWGAMNASLLAVANGDARLMVRLIRNFGLEENAVMTDLAPQHDEDYVLKDFDNLVMSSAVGIQVEFSDIEIGEEPDQGVLYHDEPE